MKPLGIQLPSEKVFNLLKTPQTTYLEGICIPRVSETTKKQKMPLKKTKNKNTVFKKISKEKRETNTKKKQKKNTRTPKGMLFGCFLLHKTNQKAFLWVSWKLLFFHLSETTWPLEAAKRIDEAFEKLGGQRVPGRENEGFGWVFWLGLGLVFGGFLVVFGCF